MNLYGFVSSNGVNLIELLGLLTPIRDKKGNVIGFVADPGDKYIGIWPEGAQELIDPPAQLQPPNNDPDKVFDQAADLVEKRSERMRFECCIDGVWVQKVPRFERDWNGNLDKCINETIVGKITGGLQSALVALAGFYIAQLPGVVQSTTFTISTPQGIAVAAFVSHVVQDGVIDETAKNAAEGFCKDLVCPEAAPNVRNVVP